MRSTAPARTEAPMRGERLTTAHEVAETRALAADLEGTDAP